MLTVKIEYVYVMLDIFDISKRLESIFDATKREFFLKFFQIFKYKFL